MFGVYDILETVGQGGMGVVYRAQDTALDRIVALKVLKEDLRQNKQIAARFQREAEAIASLNHPSIIHIYSVGAVGRIPYIAMEFITGASLSTVMKRTKAMPWKRALHIAEQVAEALACAHDAHIIHRDIKPGNILMGANDRAYVTDFGIAKVLTAETQLTVEGSRLGTPHYMSPERCSKGDITPSSDLYSLGVVMFQMLSGRLPYEAAAPVDLIRKIVAEPPARLSDYVQDIPEDVERIVAFLIEKKPVNRPKSAGYIAQLCRRVIEGEPLFEEDGVASSLKDFRDSQPTPSTTTTTHIDSALGEARGLLARASSTFRHLSPTVKLWSVGVAIVVVMGILGEWTARRSFSDYALSAVSRWDRSANGWGDTSAAADWAPESEGVTVARLNFPGFEAGTIIPAGDQGFAVELIRQPGASRHETPAIVVIDAAKTSARVGVPPNAAEEAADQSHLLAGARDASSGEKPYFFLGFGRRQSGSQALAVLQGDASLLDESYGRPAFFVDDLSNAAGSAITSIFALAASPTADTLAVAARAESAKGVQLLQVTQQDSPEHAEIAPLQLDAADLGAMTYAESGDLYVAERTAKGWACVRFSAAGETDPLVDLPADVVGILAINSAGVLAKTSSKIDGNGVTWLSFSSGISWKLGDVSGALVLSDDATAIIAAPDRRRVTQLWRVRRNAADTPLQLTFLSAGIGPHFQISRDEGYVLGTVATGSDAPALVLVTLNIAGGG